MIELTEQQRQAVLLGEAVELPASSIGIPVVLLRTDAYDEIRELLEDERRMKAIAAVAARNAVARAEDA